MDIMEAKLDKAEEEAEKIRKEMYGEVVSKEDGKEDSNEDSKEDIGDLKDTQEDTAPLEQIPSSIEETVPEPEIPKEVKAIDWEQKYKVLKGKYDKETPRALAEAKKSQAELKPWQDYARSLETQLETLNTTISTLKSSIPVKDDKAMDLDENDPDIQSLLSEYPGVGKIMKSQQAELKKSQVKIAELESQLKSKPTENEPKPEDTRFQLEMNSLVGLEWRTIDTDPKFISFLGSDKLQILQAAAALKNAKLVSAFFNEYKSTLKTPDKESDSEAEIVDDGAGEPSKLDKFVAPPRSGGVTPPKTGTARGTYTRAQYQKFMSDTIKGKYNPRDWGGRTEGQMDMIFNNAIKNHELS